MNSANSKEEVNNRLIIEQLRYENELKNRWLSLIAHDFRGMFYNVSQLVKAFESRAVSEEQFLKMLSSLKRDAEINSKTLESTFTWINSQAGGFKLHLEEFSVFGIYLSLKEKFSEQLESKRISIEFSGDRDVVICTDRFLLNIVLKHVVDNAIKYSNEGGHVTITAKRDLYGTHIAVKDNGMGMSKQVLDNLFTIDRPVYTGSMGERGVGLSLYIVKDFVQSMGAKMTVLSQLNQGSSVKFFFTEKK